MYFFTENAPDKDDCSGVNAVSSGYKAWMDATVLVLSSTETVEGTNAGRASGDGFMLVEKKISELNLYQGTSSNWKAAGDEISINNANFRVQKSYSEGYPYELNMGTIELPQTSEQSGSSRCQGEVAYLEAQ